MPPTPDPELVATARALTEGMSALGAEIAGLDRYGKRNRRLIWLTFFGLALDVILSILLSVGFVQVNHVAHVADRNSKSQKATCLSSNEARAGQLKVWNTVLDLSAKSTPTTPRSPEQQAQQAQQLASFRAYLAKVLAPRDCNHLGVK